MRNVSAGRSKLYLLLRDQDDQLINIEVEHFLQSATSEEPFLQEHARRDIRIEQGEGDIYYQVGKGKLIASQKLGERYRADGLS